MAAVRAGITAFIVTPRLLLAVVVLTLAACGGGSNGTGPEPGSTSAVSPDTNSQAASLPTAVTSTAATSASGPTDGLVALPATLANTTTAGNQTLRMVAALANGGHAVAWLSQDAAGGPAAFYVQRFDAQGARSGAETRIAYDIGAQEAPAIAVLPDGNVVIASVAARAVAGADPSTVSWTVFVRRFDIDGAPLGDETIVATLLENQAAATVRRYLAQPTLLALDDGNFVAGWASVEQDYRGKVQALRLQRYDGAGQATGVQVEFAAMGIDRNLALKLVATPGGNYVAGTTHRFMGVAYVVYRIGGHDVGPTFNADTGLPESGTTLVPLADGRYALWSAGSAGAYLQMLDAAGDATAPAVMLARLPETTVGLADGGYATLVRQATEGPVLAQRFDSAGASVGPAIALDTGYARSSAVMLTGNAAGFALAWTNAGTQDSDVMTQRVNETP